MLEKYLYYTGNVLNKARFRYLYLSNPKRIYPPDAALIILYTIRPYKISLKYRNKYPEAMAYFVLSFSVMATLDFFFLSHSIILFGIFFGVLARLEIQKKAKIVGAL